MRKGFAAIRFAGMAAFCVALLAGGARSVRAGDAEDLMALITKVPTLQMAGKFDESLPLAQKAVALSTKVNGADNPITANCIGSLADAYKGKGMRAEAEAEYERAIAVFEKADPGFSAMFLPNHLKNLAGLYIDMARYADALDLLKRATAMREKGNDPSALGMVLNDLAKTYFLLGNYTEAEAAFLRCVTELEKGFGKDHLIAGPVANNLATVYRAQGRYAEAEALTRRAIELYEKNFGAEHALVGTLWSNLAEVLRAQGRYEETEAMLKRSLGIIEKALGPDSPEVVHPVSNLGTLYHQLRRDVEAEPLLRRSLAILEKSKGADSPDAAKALNNIATLYSDQGRYGDAEPLLKRSLAIREKVVGRDHPDTGLAVNNLAVLYHDQKRYAEAVPLVKRALAIMEKNVGPDHPDVALALNNMGAMAQDEGRKEEAEGYFKRSLAIREKSLGSEHADTGLTMHNLAGLYQAMGRNREAQALYDRSLEIFKKALGSHHSMVDISLNNQAELKLQQQNWAGAAQLWDASIDLLIQRMRRGAIGANAVQTANARSGLDLENSRFWRLVKVSHRAGGVSTAEMSKTAIRMFETAQWAQNSQAAQSIAQMAARQAKGEGTLARLIRERQDLVSEWQTLDGQLIAAASQEAAKRSAKAEETARRRMVAVDARLAELDATIAKDYPDYASLASPDPLGAEEVQRLLKPDEALVLFLDTPEKAPLPEETFVWVVTKTAIQWVRADIGTTGLQREVSALRCGLDAETWAQESDCAKKLGVEYSHDDYQDGIPLPFDVKRAHALYKALFSKAEEQIKGKKLLIVASGALTQLPFQVLVTEEPRTAFVDAEGMRKVQWLIRSNALTVLPAVSSLKALRRFAKASTGTKTYIGIGNPLLDGRDRRFASLAKQARAKQSCGGLAAVQPSTGEAVYSRSINPVQITGSMANVDHIRMQCPLPETADELCSVARDLKAGENDVLLGGNATEARVKALNSQGALAQYRVLHFATHGLLAGQITADAEPGLILTPPGTATAEDDGYLSASEILGLKLNADWVILSACNTAAAKANSAEALSGMARAFFYAGARSMVVSHWSVKSKPTVALVTTALDTITADRTVPPAEALRRAMLQLIEKGSAEEAHPEYWAPFVLVGEGGGNG